jgi:hypothetical protein
MFYLWHLFGIVIPLAVAAVWFFGSFGIYLLIFGLRNKGKGNELQFAISAMIGILIVGACFYWVSHAPIVGPFIREALARAGNSD